MQMKNPKQLGYAALGVLAIVAMFMLMENEKDPKQIPSAQKAKEITQDAEKKVSASQLDQDVAKNMAVGQVILMASCLGKQGAIPREKMGDYISAAVERQGISRADLHRKWDFYWGFAKRAEEREGTSCLD